MADDDLIAAYVATLRRTLRWRTDVDDVLAEIDDHLRLAVQRAEAHGADPVLAQQDVLLRFGDAAVVARAYIVTPSGGIAMPTAFTRSCGTIALTAAIAWLLSVPAGLVGHAHVLGRFDERSHFMWAAITLLASAATAVALLGLVRRAGTTWDWRAVTALALAILSVLLIGVFTWGWPAGTALLALACLPAVLRMRAAGLRVGRLEWLLVAAWPVGIVVWLVLEWRKVGTADFYGDYLLAEVIGFGTGAVLFAAGLLAVGRWLRSEEPAGVPETLFAA